MNSRDEVGEQLLVGERFPPSYFSAIGRPSVGKHLQSIDTHPHPVEAHPIATAGPPKEVGQDSPDLALELLHLRRHKYRLRAVLPMREIVTGTRLAVGGEREQRRWLHLPASNLLGGYERAVVVEGVEHRFASAYIPILASGAACLPRCGGR
ncbi:MAG: hypothetical protein ABIQ59_16180 [Nocardioidaceae bacterium]